MATQTTNLNLTKPAEGEAYSVPIVNENMQKIDDFAGGVVKKYRHNITNQSVITTTHISDAIAACASAGYRGDVAIEFYRTDQSIVTGTLWYNLTSAAYGAGVLTSYYNDFIKSVFVVNSVVTMKTLAPYESGDWTPKLYDLDTYKRDLATGKYYRIGNFIVAFQSQQNPDLSGISTMMQIRNIPMQVSLGGSLYIGALTGAGGQITFQATDGKVYPRPNIVSSQLSTPSQPGYFNILLFGYSL